MSGFFRSGLLPRFTANKNGSAQSSIAGFGDVKVTFATEVEDIGGVYDAANSRFVATAAGVWVFAPKLYYSVLAASGVQGAVRLYKDGAHIETSAGFAVAVADLHAVQLIQYVDVVVGTVIEVYARHSSGSNATVSGDQKLTSFQGWQVG